MKMFLWEDLNEVSTAYHSGGGLVVFAESLEEARVKVAQQIDSPVKYTKVNCDAKSVDPTLVIDCAAPADPLTFRDVFVFKDAGCC